MGEINIPVKDKSNEEFKIHGKNVIRDSSDFTIFRDPFFLIHFLVIFFLYLI